MTALIDEQLDPLAILPCTSAEERDDQDVTARLPPKDCVRSTAKNTTTSDGG